MRLVGLVHASARRDGVITVSSIVVGGLHAAAFNCRVVFKRWPDMSCSAVGVRLRHTTDTEQMEDS